MIRFAGALIATTILFAACVSEQGKKDAPAATPYDYTKLEGSYRGDFGGNGDILIVLRHVTDKNAVGYDLHKGLRRNITGEFSGDGKGFKFLMREPGDNQYDGVFEFVLDTSNNQIAGNWKPARGAQQGVKSYMLTKEILDAADEVENYRHVFEDQFGQLRFEKDGLCVYRYYPKTNDTSGKEQYLEIKGNWRRDDKQYTVTWQKNTVFKNKESIFKMVKEYGGSGPYYNIIGEGRTFYWAGSTGY